MSGGHWYASPFFGRRASPRVTPSLVAPVLSDRLNSAINACLADLTLKTRLAEVGGIPFLSSPTDFGISSLRKPRSGPRSSSSPASNRNRNFGHEISRGEDF